MGSLTSVVALSKQSQVLNPNPKSQSYAMSRSSYPSAHGHTPSYRSAASTVYPSALGTDAGGFSSGLGSSSSIRSTAGLSDMERDMARHLSSTSSLSTSRSPLAGSSGSSSTYKTEKYSSNVSSANGGLPP